MRTNSEPSLEAPAVGDRLLDVHEAAAMLGLKPTTLYRWGYERRIATVKLSGPRGPLRFRLSTLQQLIARSERPAVRGRFETSGERRRVRGR